MRYLPLLLLALLILAAPSHADEDPADGVAVPDILGKTETDAVAALEAAGFHAEVVTVAGTCPNLIADQWPKGGVAYEPGATVRVKLCIPVTVMTQAPDVTGKHESDMLPTLEPIYYVEREYVGGRDEEPGTIFEQIPEPGTDLPYRGELVLRIAANAVTLPSVLGMDIDEATVHLQGEGLEVRTFAMESSEEEPGTIVSQMPGAGADVLPGAVVTLGVAGSEEDAQAPDVTASVPEVRGLDVQEAYAALLEAGLVPHTTFVDDPSASADDAWRVIEQEPEAGDVLAPGDEVSLGVLRPGGSPALMRVPSLIGLSLDQASEVLRSVGLTPRARLVPSAFASGRVLQQTPAPGAEVAPGGEVTFAVSRRTVTHTPAVRIPDLRGTKLLDARLALLGRGLDVRIVYRIAPGAPLRRVVAQAPLPGRAVPAGGRVHLAVPAESVVPPLIGLQKNDAEQALQSAGLGVDFHGDHGHRARVVRQGARPNSRVARGTRIDVHLEREVPDVLVRAPNVTGLRAALAVQEVEAAGLVPQLVGPRLGRGVRQIVAQAPRGGMQIPRGSEVHLRFAWEAGGDPTPTPGRRVRVPQLAGKRLAEAQSLLQERGLLVSPVGPSRGSGQRIVQSQTPAAGTRVTPGTRVRVAWRYAGGGHPQAPQVRVPGLVGHSVESARRALEGRGLRVRIAGGAAPADAVVEAQAPGRRTQVSKGSFVTLRVAAPARPPQAVVVPNLVGTPANKAAAQLKSLGLVPRIVSSGTPGKIVLKQGHVGQRATAGTVIPLLVGSNPEPKKHHRKKR